MLHFYNNIICTNYLDLGQKKMHIKLNQYYIIHLHITHHWTFLYIIFYNMYI